MSKKNGADPSTYIAVLLLLVSFFLLPCLAVEDDVLCLEGIKRSLSDPDGRLSGWDFTNTSVSFICNLDGVTCWNLKESRLLSIRLSSFGLSGRFPESLKYCHSLQSLYLSENSISGPLPPQICSWLPYLVTLDLSNNSLSGPIPPQIADCKFLNDLVLNDNRLSGSIPYEVARLDRLRQLSVAGNGLSGPIPADLSKFSKEAFAGNSGLCGKPLKSCGGLSNKSLAVIIAAGVVGAAVSVILGFLVWWVYFNRRKRGYGAAGGREDSNWVEFLRAYKLVQVSLFQKPLVKIKLADLLAATNSFDPRNIVSSNQTGVSYRAVLPDGSVLAVKRLCGCNLSEKQFRLEMNRLGQLRHPNLVPLLGYCMVEEEKLLVYKHMHNGSLHSNLHEKESNPYGISPYCSLDWPTRLRLGLGAARGLAWLHHGLEPPCLHQNVSSNVVLLDDDLEARLTDFGLARLVGMNDGPSSIRDADVGQLGYRGMEDLGAIAASLKEDVYSFGVVLLELVTGQQPPEVYTVDGVYKGNLVDWASQLSGSGRGKDAIDRSLRGRGYDEEITEVMRVACSCVVSRLRDRPSMYRVYESLKSIGAKHGFSEMDDEFPMIFGRQDSD
ncbi:probable inactive receptor kinase At1g27190 [Punica granatum]|uniref:Protein kinase domain-containing protein n=2 Tax=Punica granatum TaxID=22663 RepID=A0A218WT11_PUNGR|nr:probable inactive receptor kinase At1g27190 [Punica granatum]OWM76007.1 hypothetical protein CDL15_Pgr009652 [Punica granatum]PKI56194.1 hypothetical protein CRG98_023389 [Punica granatum]